MFLPNKIIKNKKMNYPQNNVGLSHGFKTMYGGDVVMFFPKKIKNNKKYYMSTINSIKY